MTERRRWGENPVGPRLIGWPATIVLIVLLIVLMVVVGVGE